MCLTFASVALKPDACFKAFSTIFQTKHFSSRRKKTNVNWILQSLFESALCRHSFTSPCFQIPTWYLFELEDFGIYFDILNICSCLQRKCFQKAIHKTRKTTNIYPTILCSKIKYFRLTSIYFIYVKLLRNMTK